jgi:hypothetical protein
MNFPFFVASIALLVYSIHLAYQAWIGSKKFVLLNQKQRRKYRRQFRLMPQIMTFDFYDDHPVFEVWINRIVSVIFIAAAILGIVVSIRGPFHGN